MLKSHWSLGLALWTSKALKRLQFQVAKLELSEGEVRHLSGDGSELSQNLHKNCPDPYFHVFPVFHVVQFQHANPGDVEVELLGSSV